MNPTFRHEPSHAITVEISTGLTKTCAQFDPITGAVYLFIGPLHEVKAALRDAGRDPAGVVFDGSTPYFAVAWLKQKFPAQAATYDAYATLARHCASAMEAELRARATDLPVPPPGPSRPIA